MPTKEQVRRLLDNGLDYQAAGRELGIPPGQAYLIATGVPADGSDAITEEEAKRPGFLPSSQHLMDPPDENPTAEEAVAAWLNARVATDGQMRTALREHTAQPPEHDKQSPDAITVPAARTATTKTGRTRTSPRGEPADGRQDLD